MRMRRLALILIVLVTACSAAGPPTRPRGPAAPTGGTVAGRVVSQRSDGSGRTPVSRQRVGAFREAIIPGKPVQHPPDPVAVSVTGADGSFRLTGLSPGRYFITVVVTGLAVPGHWVTVTASRGARVLLIHCTDCPGPR
jgi:hypothetical protein